MPLLSSEGACADGHADGACCPTRRVPAIIPVSRFSQTQPGCIPPMKDSIHSHARREVCLISGPSAWARAQYIRMLRRPAGPQGQPQRPSLWMQAAPASAGQPLLAPDRAEAGTPMGPKGLRGAQHGARPGAPSLPSYAAAAASVALPEALSGGAPDQQLLGGCICCLGGPVFRTTLVRLLRESGWQRLYLELDERGSHLMSIIDQLRSPPFDQYLRISELVRVLPAAPGHVAAQPSAGEVPPGWASISVWPLSAPPARSEGASEGQGALPASMASVAPVEVADWQQQHHDPLGADDAWPADRSLRLCWPADGGLPSRQEVLERLEALAAIPGVCAAHAVLQTARSAYAWHVGAAVQPDADERSLGACRQDLSPVPRLQETVWRLDNRLWLGMAQGTDLAALNVAIQQLQHLWIA